MKKIKRLLRFEWPLHFVLVLTNWLPDNVFFLKLRGKLASPFFGSCGKNLELARNILIHNPINIHLGNDVFFAFGCLIMATDKIIIHDQVMFGPYCVIISGNHTRARGSFRFGEPYLSPIEIMQGCWLGSHVVVTAGSKIGEGSLIAAGAVVAGQIDSNVLAGGVPARIIKSIEDEEKNY